MYVPSPIGRARASAPAGAAAAHRRSPRRRTTRFGAPDEFGLDPEFRERVLPIFRLLYDKYWRVDAKGMRNVPRRGPTILVANHSGALPFDATMIACALHAGHHPRATRFLYDRFVDNLPLIPQIYQRAGGVLASHANAERLLEKGELVGLFPEGVAGLSKLFSERYVLQPFSSGFVRLALRHRAAIVPVAVVGAEEIYPLVGRMRALGKLVGIPYLPVTPFFPLLGPLGMIPLPSKWMIRFGKPIVLDVAARRSHGGIAMRTIAEHVRLRVQRMVRALLRRRDGVF
ncbi:MAG: acyltransferase family protein [Deltaproteobacteria bacterium]|nr:acyltransferase family protein [Deltaproteobacteria bacterium]